MLDFGFLFASVSLGITVAIPLRFHRRFLEGEAW
jgi:hypothetical protein